MTLLLNVVGELATALDAGLSCHTLQGGRAGAPDPDEQRQGERENKPHGVAEFRSPGLPVDGAPAWIICPPRIVMTARVLWSCPAL